VADGLSTLTDLYESTGFLRLRVRSTGKTDGLLQPYKVSVWETIPSELADPDGYWYGDYYGVMAFEVNSSLVKNVPQDWPDLLKPEYTGQVALAGDPGTSSQAINGVYAAALAGGGSADNAAPGLEFFSRLNQAGNFVPVITVWSPGRSLRAGDQRLRPASERCETVD